MRVIKIKLPLECNTIILDLLKKKQHIRNMLIIIREKTKNEWLKFNILNFMTVRNAFRADKKYNKETGLKLRKLIREEFGKEYLENMNEIISIMSNKLVVDIIKELKANYDTSFKLLKKNLIDKFTIHTKKLVKVKNGSININSNNVKLKDDTLKLTIFSKKYEHEKNFIYILDTKALNLNSNNIKNCNLQIRNYIAYLNITYQEDNHNNLKSNNRFASIDIGSNNHLTLFVQDAKSLLIRNRCINRINYLVNNIVPIIQSKIDKMFTNNRKNKKFNQNRYNKLDRRRAYLYEKRNIICNQEIHKIVNYIIKYLKLNKITNLIYGHNKNIKKDLNLGKDNNKKFYQFPHSILKNTLVYRCKQEGINLFFQEESYTSKTSCLTDEVWKFGIENKKQNPTEINGLRGFKKIYSLFKDKKLNIIFHADVNGSINILQKFLKKRIEDIYQYQLFNPITIRNEFDFKKLLNLA